MAVQVAEEDENDTEIDPDLKNAVCNLIFVHVYICLSSLYSSVYISFIYLSIYLSMIEFCLLFTLYICTCIHLSKQLHVVNLFLYLVIV